MLDFTLFRAINGLTGASLLLDAIGIFFAVHLLGLMLALLATLAIIRKKMYIFLLAIASGTLGYLVSQVIGLINFRPRPFAFLSGVNLLISKSPMSKSFPSDHATLAFALALSLYFSGEKKLGIIFTVLAFLVGLGRIFVGVHFPLDITAGTLLGILSAFAVNKVWRIISVKLKTKSAK